MPIRQPIHGMKGRTFSLDAGRAEAGVEVVDVQGAVIQHHTGVAAVEAGQHGRSKVRGVEVNAGGQVRCTQRVCMHGRVTGHEALAGEVKGAVSALKHHVTPDVVTGHEVDSRAFTLAEVNMHVLNRRVQVAEQHAALAEDGHRVCIEGARSRGFEDGACRVDGMQEHLGEAGGS